MKIILCPDQLGVLHVGGRLGAARGPRAFLDAWARFSGPRAAAEVEWVGGLGREIRANLDTAAAIVEEAHGRGERTLFVGGGHDHGFSQLLGVRRGALRSRGRGPANFRLGCINIDAHLDLRACDPVITSGSPYRLAIEEGVIAGEDLLEFGVQRHCNGPALLEYAREKRVEIRWWETLRNVDRAFEFTRELAGVTTRCDAVVLSIDLDAAAEAYAPGVSSPVSEGFTADDLIAIAEFARAEPKIVSLGIFELNPEHDRDGMTARLAARIAYAFCAS